MNIQPVPILGIFLLCSTILGESVGDDLPEVTIPQGRVIGRYLKSDKGNEYEAFLGIPYAKPPAGKLRFKEPQLPYKWKGYYNASQYGRDCLQYFFMEKTKIIGSENCLFINVYRPKASIIGNTGPLDVIAYIHGGGFTSLAARYSEPTFLIDKNIIFVTFNYRLGPLGFMSTGDKAMPGNLGLKDQAAALKWIQNNINYFGGNPNNIMLTGGSAGGASVHLHYFSPLSQGLFTKGISGSGVGLNPWSIAESVPQKTKRLAALLGCPTNNSHELVECLTHRPAEQIVSQLPNFFMGLMSVPIAPFGPVVEPEGTKDPFLPIHPFDALESGQFTKVPWLASYALNEGLLIEVFGENGLKRDILEKLDENWSEFAPHVLDYNFTVKQEDRKIVAETIRSHYLKGKSMYDGVEELFQMNGDRIFNAGIVQSVLMQATAAPVYMYRYGYKRKVPMIRNILPTDKDYVCHCEDGAYIVEFKFLSINVITNDEEEEMQRNLINVWMTFLKSGVPEFHDGIPLPNAQEGLPKLKYLEIRSPSNATIETADELGELFFWSTVQLDEKLGLPKITRKFQEEL